MADQWREPLSGSMTARILLQQPIPVFDRVRTLACSSTDFFRIVKIRGASAHCHTDDLHIATLTIHELLHGRPRIALQLSSENLRDLSAKNLTKCMNLFYHVFITGVSFRIQGSSHVFIVYFNKYIWSWVTNG